MAFYYKGTDWLNLALLHSFQIDTYRFLDFLSRALLLYSPPSGGLAVDIGTGGGAGAIFIARHASRHQKIIGLDINPSALRLARINAIASSVHSIDFRESNLLSALSADECSQLNLVVSNPPYIAGAIATYADGGDECGLALPWQIVYTSLAAMTTGGLFMLYTGVPISLQGHDPLRHRLDLECGKMHAELVRYELIDVDVFGDELEDPEGAYGTSDVGRIAVVGCILRKL